MNLITEVHKIGLQVILYTFRNETTACSDYNNDPSRVPSFYKLGIDAVFSDFTDTAVKRKIN
jgi:glycerophosphoryl diester phosphodiesterase